MNITEMIDTINTATNNGEGSIVKVTKTTKTAKRDYVFTPYQATKVMNEARRALGLKEVNSPMIYIYARKGAFTITQSDDGTNRKIVNEDEFLEWMNAHNAKQITTKK